MAEVVLVFPKISGFSENDRPPLGILYLAAVLVKEGFDVKLIDETVSESPHEILASHLDHETICVGISSVTGPQLQAGLDTARFIRHIRPDLPIVWGGVHVTIDSREALKNDLVDAVCIGEGEITFIEMVKAMRDGRSLDTIQGIGFKRNGEPALTEPRKEYYSLDNLPELPYHLYDLDKYTKSDESKNPYWGFDSGHMFSLETSRGCPFECGYCVQSVKNEKIRMMSPETVVSFFEKIISLGGKAVTILDDNFFSNQKHATRTLNAINDRGWDLEIFAAIRADTVVSMKPELADLISKTGVKMFGVGAESGSDRILKKIGKRESVAMTHKASARLKKMKKHAWFLFITGFPWETLDDLIKTYASMTRILKTNPYSRIAHNKLMVFPGTPVFADSVARGWPAERSMEEWGALTDPAWTKHVSYLDPEVVAWSRNTLYYTQIMGELSEIRTPSNMNKNRLRLIRITMLFYFWSMFIAARSRLRWSGPFLDNALRELIPKARSLYPRISTRLNKLAHPLMFIKRFSRNLCGVSLNPTRVLLIRSSREWHLKKIIATIDDAWKCEIALLCPKPFVTEYQNMFPSLSFITTDNNMSISWDGLGAVEKKTLVDFRPDIALIPTMEVNSTVVEKQYENIFTIARNTKAEETLVVTADGSIKPVTG